MARAIRLVLLTFCCALLSCASPPPADPATATNLRVCKSATSSYGEPQWALEELGLPYDLPTLDDEDRPGVNDAHDPFGGNNGKNQAIVVPGGPVQVHSPMA